MPFSKRMKFSAIASVIAAVLGSFLIFLLNEPIRKDAVTALIAAAAIFAVALIVSFLLEGKTSKVRVPVYTLLILVSVCVIASFLMYSIGMKFAFPGSSDEDAYESLLDVDGKVVEIEAGELSGWRIPAISVPADAKRPVILYFGGNGENSSTKVSNILNNDALTFLYRNYDFIYIDYPSYGNSGGTISENSIMEYALAAYETAASLDTTSGITVLSYSIGNGPAAYLAGSEEAEIDNLIMLAPYYSGLDLFNSNIDIFHGPLVLLAGFRMPAYKYAKNITCPVTMIASADDEVIPIESSRALFAALTNNSANFITVNEIGHNDFFSEHEVIDSIINSLEAA